MTDASTLAKQIRYTEFRRPTLRSIAAFVLLLPVTLRELGTNADRAVVVALGAVCAGGLLYALWKLHRLKSDFPSLVTDGELPEFKRYAIVVGVSLVATLGGIVAVIAVSEDWAKWATLVSLLAAVVAMSHAVYTHNPRRTSTGAPIAQPSGYKRSMGPEPRFAGDAIACSGGGIRAAAFCLGGLQRLRTPTVGSSSFYDGAKRVFGVSGGGYIATSLHLARLRSDASVQADLFSPGSPEEDWLRRRSKYLLPSGSIVPGILAVVYGIAVNLALIALTLFLAAWYAGWLHTRADGVCGEPGQDGKAVCLLDGGVASWRPEPVLVWAGVLMLGLGLLWFVIAKALSKYRPRGALLGMPVTRALVAAGAGVAVLFIVLPWLIVNLGNATIANEPTPVVAKAMSAARLATPEACKAAVERSFETEAAYAWQRTSDRSKGVPFTYGACGDEWTDDAAIFAPGGSALVADDNALCEAGASPRPSYCDDRSTKGISGWERVAAWLAAMGALVAAIRGLMRGFGGSGTASAKPSRLSTFTDALLRTVLPWTALVVLAIIVVILLLNLTRDNLVAPERLEPAWSPLWSYWVWIPLAVLAIRVLTDAILGSLHPFYRERLSETFLIRRNAARKEAESLPYEQPTHVHESSGAQAPSKGPELTICCAANLNDRDYIPAARGCASFLFRTSEDGGEIGISDARLPDGRMRPAEAYSAASDPQGLDTTLAAAMATSGAAFSPLAGRQSGRLRPYRVLLALVNARLGVWLPNPYLVSAESATVAPPGSAPDLKTGIKWAWHRARRPGPYRIYKEAFGALSIYDIRIYVTDGGHYDNTGIVEALRDRPARLVVLDASADPRDSLDALGDAIVTARMDLGLVITPAEGDLSVLKGHVDPDTNEYVRPEQAWIRLNVSTVAEPAVTVCTIWFVKNVLVVDAEIGLETYAAENPAFPLTSTVNQFYGEYDFEAYRALGYMNTTQMMTNLEAAGALPAGALPAV